jgi:hypothetical protein
MFKIYELYAHMIKFVLRSRVKHQKVTTSDICDFSEQYSIAFGIKILKKSVLY